MRVVTWEIHRDSDGGYDMRFFLRINKTDIGESYDQFVHILREWEQDPQSSVLHVRDWHEGMLIISLDIGDRNSKVPAEPVHIWDQSQYEQERQRLSSAVLQSLNTIHRRLAWIDPEVNPQPQIIHDWWMNQPPSTAQSSTIVSY